MVEAVLIYWHTGGALMPALALVTFGIWFFFLRMRRDLAEVLATPPGFEGSLSVELPRQPRDESLRRYRQMGGALPALTTRVLEAVTHNVDVEGAFAEQQRGLLTRLDRDTAILSALTAAAPLLGLLGTVLGMVATFQAVAAGSGETARQVSSGISQALITTQVGLIAAIPGLFGLARIQRMLSQVRVRLDTCRVHLLLGLAS